ncbi:hypothetical protein NKH77_03900 [Streptomyces sp. M19]
MADADRRRDLARRGPDVPHLGAADGRAGPGLRAGHRRLAAALRGRARRRGPAPRAGHRPVGRPAAVYAALLDTRALSPRACRTCGSVPAAAHRSRWICSTGGSGPPAFPSGRRSA